MPAACRPCRRGAHAAAAPTPQQATCTKGSTRVKGRWRGRLRGSLGRDLSSIYGGRGVWGRAHRSTDEKSADADQEGDVGPGGAGAGASLHREEARGRPREPRPSGRQGQPLRRASGARCQVETGMSTTSPAACCSKRPAKKQTSSSCQGRGWKGVAAAVGAGGGAAGPSMVPCLWRPAKAPLQGVAEFHPQVQTHCLSVCFLGFARLLNPC